MLLLLGFFFFLAAKNARDNLKGLSWLMISEVSIHRQLSFLCLAHVFKGNITAEGCQVKGDQEAEWD